VVAWGGFLALLYVLWDGIRPFLESALMKLRRLTRSGKGQSRIDFDHERPGELLVVIHRGYAVFP